MITKQFEMTSSMHARPLVSRTLSPSSRWRFLQTLGDCPYVAPLKRSSGRHLGQPCSSSLRTCRLHSTVCSSGLSYNFWHYPVKLNTLTSVQYLHLGKMTSSFSSSATSKFSNSPLIQPGDVNLSDDRIVLLDGSWYLDKNRDPKDEFKQSRLPGAKFFDIDQICDKSSSLPHMLPTAKQFEESMTDLGVGNDDIVIIYTGKDCFSAARCWWTFCVFGHSEVYILDANKVMREGFLLPNSGLPRWIAEGKPTESEVQEKETKQRKSGDTSRFSKAPYKANFRQELVKTIEDVMEVCTAQDTKVTLVDARSEARFFAKAPEPREGMRGGHMPGAKNVPFANVVKEGDASSFRTVNEIKEAFKKAGVDLNSADPIITTCGSGVTAATLTFAMKLAGRQETVTPVYDGSWSEWGSREDTPITKT